MMVAKAYQALTDETAKENYEKYGNPAWKAIHGSKHRIAFVAP
jgi:preprotein translocase subunit Sec63